MRQGQRSWFATLVGLPQLSLETILSLMTASDEFRENVMLVGYARATREKKLI